jgi:hypothetical protein
MAGSRLVHHAALHLAIIILIIRWACGAVFGHWAPAVPRLFNRSSFYAMYIYRWHCRPQTPRSA